MFRCHCSRFKTIKKHLKNLLCKKNIIKITEAAGLIFSPLSHMLRSIPKFTKTNFKKTYKKLNSHHPKHRYWKTDTHLNTRPVTCHTKKQRSKKTYAYFSKKFRNSRGWRRRFEIPNPLRGSRRTERGGRMLNRATNAYYVRLMRCEVWEKTTHVLTQR